MPLLTVGGQSNNTARLALRGLADPPSGTPQNYFWYDAATGHAWGFVAQTNSWADLGSWIGVSQDPTRYSNPNELPAGGGGIGGATGNTGTPTEPCPCEWRSVKTMMFLSDTPTPNSLPVSVTKEKWVCDQPINTHTKVNCDETNLALENPTQQQVTGLADASSILDNVDYSGSVSVDSGKSQQASIADIPSWAKFLIGGVVLGGVGYYIGKHA